MATTSPPQWHTRIIAATGRAAFMGRPFLTRGGQGGRAGPAALPPRLDALCTNARWSAAASEEYMTVLIGFAFGLVFGALLGYGISALDYSDTMAERRRACLVNLLRAARE